MGWAVAVRRGGERERGREREAQGRGRESERERGRTRARPPHPASPRDTSHTHFPRPLPPPYNINALTSLIKNKLTVFIVVFIVVKGYGCDMSNPWASTVTTDPRYHPLLEFEAVGAIITDGNGFDDFNSQIRQDEGGWRVRGRRQNVNDVGGGGGCRCTVPTRPTHVQLANIVLGQRIKLFSRRYWNPVIHLEK